MQMAYWITYRKIVEIFSEMFLKRNKLMGCFLISQTYIWHFYKYVTLIVATESKSIWMKLTSYVKEYANWIVGAKAYFETIKHQQKNEFAWRKP